MAGTSRGRWMGPGILTLLSLVTIWGCGGDGGTGPDQKPTPTPASIAVHAGSGQSAAVNTAVATAPAVVVRDAQGRAVAGVRVTFTVEQGGGSIGSANPTTDQGGVATAGQWMLGPAPGPQKLSATVAGLPRVTFEATATAASDASGLVTQPVGVGGGVVTVASPGSQLDGVRLSFDAGALAGAVPVTLSEVPVSSLTIPAGMVALTPGLGISAAATTRLGAGATVRFPVPASESRLLMVGFADPGTGRLTLLPTVRREQGALTALLPSVSAAGVGDARMSTAPLLNASLAAATSLGLQDTPGSVTLLLAINPELLDRDFDSGYRPGADDWDFPRMAIADLPFLRSTGGAAPSFAVADDGLVSTSLWYYANRRKQGGAQLNGLTQLLPGQPMSSRAGIRWAALAEKDVPSFNQVGGLLVREWNEWATDDRGRFLWLQFQGIKAMMLTTFERPVPVVLLDTDNPDEFNADAHPLAIAYRTVGNTLYLAWPGSPGQPIQAQFSEQGMTPFTLSNPNGTAITVRAIGGVHYVNVVDEGKLAAQWPRVAAGTIGDAEGWPTPKLHWEKAELDTARVYLLDELQMWWQCAQCVEKVPRPSQLPATASHVQRFRYIGIPPGESPALSGSFSSMKLGADDAFKGSEKIARKGFLVQHPVQSDDFVGTAVGWLDWQSVVFRKLELEPSVQEIEASQDTTITITVTPSEAPPTGTRYRWLLRTDDVQDSVETTVPTHTRDIEGGTEGWLVFSALEGEHKRPIARDSIKVGGDGPVAAWRILTLGDPDEIFDEAEGSGNEVALLRRLIQAPTSGLITIEEVDGEKALRLRVKRSGSWSQDDCCQLPAFNSGAERLMPLGFIPARSHPVGPFFSGWGTSYWEQSSNSLDAGTVTGQYAMGTASYPIKDAGSQVGPAGGIRISATRNGTMMTGELRIYIWFIDEESGEVEEDADIYRLPFTAVRMR